MQYSYIACYGIENGSFLNAWKRVCNAMGNQFWGQQSVGRNGGYDKNLGQKVLICLL